jgi:chorismate synthase
MPGSSIGRLFRVTTFGESHGPAIGALIEGVPPNMPLTEAEIQKELNRRRPGQSKVATPRDEKDKVEIISGVFDGRCMGPPVALLIRNQNMDSSAYIAFKDKFRPGHADWSYQVKYGVRDWRGSGRASGRETACRVAAGAVAKKVLAAHGVSIVGYSLEIAGVRAQQFLYDEIENNIVRSPDPDVAEEMIARIEAAKAEEDSVGGIVEVVVRGCPPGLGDPVFDKLEARLAQAVMSIGAVKGFEMGSGFAGVKLKGSQFNDPFVMADGKVRTKTNHSGGILGGIATGEEIVLRCAVRPPASIAKTQQTINLSRQPDSIEVHGRHDPCIVPRAVPVVEAMVALTLADCLLIQLMYQHNPHLAHLVAGN